MALACYNLISQDLGSYPSVFGIQNDLLGDYNGLTTQIAVPSGGTLQCYLVQYNGNCPGATPITPLDIPGLPCGVDPDYCGCPPDYVLAPNGLDCVLNTEISAVASPTIYTAIAATPQSFFGHHTKFYETTQGRPIPATMTSAPLGFQDATSIQYNSVIVSGNTLWGMAGTNTPADGRLNYAGIWTNGGTSGSGAQLPENEWIGFSTCVDVPVDGVYCIGMAADNCMRFSINGVLIVQNLITNSFAFNYWHVFPVQLSAGLNLISIEGLTTGGFASFGAEIYQQTSAILQTYTTQVELDAVTIFTTRDKIGQTFQLGSDSGYSCPTGYALNTCDPIYTCSLVERTPFHDCFVSYILSKCGAVDTFITITDLSTQVGKTVTLEGIEGCWQVGGPVNQETTTTVTILEEFTDCAECLPVCYLLVECNNLLPPIKTQVDLSAQVGKYIKISSCPKNCWQVFLAPDCTGVIIPVNPTFSFDTCEDYNPPVILPTPEVLHSRKVKPGYNTPGCSPEYTEKINCNFADQVYNKMIQVRYGITPCCEDEYDKYLLKKELLDLQAIYDEDGCRSTCFTCKAPCGVETSMRIYYPIYCLPPGDVDAVLTIITGPCDAPTSVVASAIRIFRIRALKII